MIQFKVRLNGTTVNPFHGLGLKQNPFPQVGMAEYRALEYLLSKLSAEPIRDTTHLRELMEGADQAFIEGCCDRFQKGVIVEFTIEFPEGK